MFVFVVTKINTNTSPFSAKVEVLKTRGNAMEFIVNELKDMAENQRLNHNMALDVKYEVAGETKNVLWDAEDCGHLPFFSNCVVVNLDTLQHDFIKYTIEKKEIKF